MNNRLFQAYHQAPWRTQLQWIGAFSLGLILVASVAWIYLNVSAQAAEAGRSIQNMQAEMQNVHREIADLRSEVAFLTSAAQMEKRAKEKGFVPVEALNAVYMDIPGYVPRRLAELAPPPGPGMIQAPLIQPDYTMSVWDWLFRNFGSAVQAQGQLQR